MKKLIFLTGLLLTSLVSAQSEQPKHIISIGTEGFGWSGTALSVEQDEDKTDRKDQQSSAGSLNLNYNYVFTNRIMVGALLGFESTTSEHETVDGEEIESESFETRIGLSVGYNFNEELVRSWWVRGTLGSGNSESETKSDSGKNKTDSGYGFFALSGGKRISLDAWGLKNISYNPSLTIESRTVSGDNEDAGIDSIAAFTIDLIRFDILF